MNHIDRSAMPKPASSAVSLGQLQSNDFTSEGAPPPGMVNATQPQHTPLVLNAAALETASQSPPETLESPQQAAWVADVIALLNGALATEWVCVLRYRRHHFTAKGLAALKVAQEFLVHANEELVHADRLARRIVQLGGQPDFSPSTLLGRSHAPYDESLDLFAMIRCNLQAERVAIEAYGQMIDMVGTQDPTTRRLLEDILAQEQAHAEELSDWLMA